MKEEMMFKYAQIRNSYARKRFGTLTNEEKALIDYETFCLELIKENENLQSQLKAKEEVIKEAREFINRKDICIDIRDNELNYISTDKLDEILSKGENK